MPKFEDLRQLDDAASAAADIVKQKASTLSVSLAIIFVFFALSAGGFVYGTKDVWLEGYKLKLDTEHLHKEHTECRAKITELETRVRDLERQVARTASIN